MESEPSVDQYTNASIIVVDDNTIKRYTTARSLEQAGFTVIQGETGADALRLVQQGAALVVLDVKLPDMDGFEVCRQLKSDPKTQSVPVLHLSAHRISSRDLAAGLEGGADAYLTVPVEPEVLVATVRALIRLYRAEETARIAAHVWRATFDAIRDAVFLLSKEGVVTRGNGAAAALVGTDQEALLGVSFSAILEKWGVDPTFQELLFENGQGDTIEVALENDRWVRLTADSIQEDGVTAGMVCTISDITTRVLAEQERAEAAAKNERIAETLQRSLLLTSRADAFPGIEIEGIYEAAWNESLIGGDFSDVFAVADNCVALVVGDVTGKGLAAATYTAEIKFALRAFLRDVPDPAPALTRLNHYLLESRRLETQHDPEASLLPERYVALTLAIIHTESGVARCSSAGAEPPVVLRSKTEGWEALEESCSPLLGMDETSEYHSADVILESGDLLLLATDGITEARPPGRGKQFFGLKGMAEAARSAMYRTVGDVGETVLQAVLAFAEGHQNDDICLLTARRKEKR